MQHLILHFTHAIGDIIPWCAFVEELRPQLARSGVGEFESDDMAIDGGDCEAVFRGLDAKALFTALLPHFQNLPFLQKPTTKVVLVFGELGGSSEQQVFGLVDGR
ncbi:hypothetical protein ODJ70_24660 [Pseudomonas aeruginosa]|uniref:hypothetical protein n=1 Tax=Pseudomonas aeruginosa group TaxID=136841 RepID=UPI000F53C260|nr:MULTISPECIES: hypothetical protein [Pseudomonas aeruginosa group]EKX5733265.1 hypothetical protein [Pseudomonas aeruginosa]MEB3868738.1 hypothetical protein [Pseudomonas aeruginosa]MEB3892800.1 hypothetical protein [Pseudomonas aeruginosa]MEB3916215.1 hypothetical protein [Pseudomonas aeruginosa]MEB3941356.1 hypothetical protein [Pseudomonas aeruginosa]